MTRGRSLRFVGGVLVLVVGAVHLQQYADFIKDIPTIGELFLLNAAGAGVLAILLATPLHRLAELGGIGYALGTVVALGISRYADGGLFDYKETTLRTPVLISVIAALAAAVALAGSLLAGRSAAASPSAASAARRAS